MKIKSIYYKKDKFHLVDITAKKEKRTFRMFSGRAGKTLALMAETYPKGITTKDMRIKHNIDDNKLFGELLDQSGFREYLECTGTENRLKVWKLKLIELFKNTSNSITPIWFGIHTQINIQKFFDKLEKKYGLRCNILGVELLKEYNKKFLSNFRRIAIDHRIPQSKNGKDIFSNLQLLSYYVNERKNQICAICPNPKCKKCALAFPEKNFTIWPTGENISTLTNWRKH